MMPHTKYQGFSLVVSDRKNLSYIPIEAYVKHVFPRRDCFWPQRHNFNKLGRGPLGHASYQISRRGCGCGMWYLIVSIPDLCTLSYFCRVKSGKFGRQVNSDTRLQTV